VGNGFIGGRPSAPAPLPQSGVLASTFVGGAGVEARLSDLLERGVMIDGHQVRIEAVQDRARLPYGVPSVEAVALHAELERTKVRARGDTVHLQIALLAKQGEAPPRPRLDLRLVVDRSGSMQDEGKWQNAIAAAHALVSRLERGDTFGLISYAENASLDFAPATVGNGQAIHRAIDALRPGGGTNIGDALEVARQNAPQRRGPSDVAMVILLSDGMATVGVTDPRSLADTARKMFDDGGVLTTSIGVGTSFDEETMLGIAREGSGSYHFVRRAADISEILRDELEQRIQAVAQALRVRVVLGGGVVARRVYGSRLLSEDEHAAVRATEVATDTRIARELGITSDRARENEEGLRIHLPTFRRGDQHVILMELDVPGGRAGSMAGVARVYLEYKDLGRRENDSEEALVLAERVSDIDDAMASVERTVKRTVLSFQAGEALQVAASALSSEDAAAAATLLAERRELLEAAAAHWRDPSLSRDATLLARYETVVDRAWNGFGSDDRRTLVMAMNYFGDRRMR
jgi:Ca-activated chloride channel family protein